MSRKEHEIIEVRHLTENTFVIRMVRNGFVFQPGHHIHVGIPGSIHTREYSVYSPVWADYLEILVKMIPEGYLTPRLHKLKPGSRLTVEGPFGFFTVPQVEKAVQYYLIATGTGIAPYHSITQSFPEARFRIYHGVRRSHECYEASSYRKNSYFSCLTDDISGYYQGRVTKLFQSLSVEPEAHYYLCGNSNMIFEMFEILSLKGVPASGIHTEVYF